MSVEREDATACHVHCLSLRLSTTFLTAVLHCGRGGTTLACQKSPALHFIEHCDENIANAWRSLP